jgi:hypothetical protein
MAYENKDLILLAWSLFCVGEEPGQRRGVMAPHRGGVEDEHVKNFLKNREVLESTRRYLQSIEEMWIRSGCGQHALVRKFELPALAEIQPEKAPDKSATPRTVEKHLENKPAPQHEAQPQALAQPPVVQLQPSIQPQTQSQPLAQTTVPVAVPTVSQPIGSATLNKTTRPGQLPPAGAPLGKLSDPSATFHLPNAKVGQAYVGKLEGTDPTGKPVIIIKASVVGAGGLTFDPATSELRGTPTIDGDHKVVIIWSPDDVVPYAGECLLIVNPDPRSLWKKIATDAGDHYFKPDTAGALIEGSAFRIAAASRRGRSHEHVGSFRDDDFFINHDANSGWSVLIVADGAGSAKNSRWGSKLAVAAAGEHLVASLAGDIGAKVSKSLENWTADPASAGNAAGSEFHYLFHKAALLAVQTIEAEAQKQASAIKEYSTTLLVAAVKQCGTEMFLATFWMGDGAIAAYGPRGTVKLMGTPDGGEFAGQTRFLDRSAINDQGFGKRISIGRLSNLSGIVLMTDGISDPRFETDNGLVEPTKWDALWDEITPCLISSEPDKALIDWLDFFSPGHHDDRTIAILW